MRLKKGFVLREICGENVVTAEGIENINFNKLISLNETAAFLFKKVEGHEFTAQNLADFLVEEYEIDMNLALTDAEKLCEAWQNAGITE